MNNIRRLDDLGRVVIPKEIRRVLGISEGDPLEVNVNTKTGQIIIEKYEVEPDKRCNWCGSYIVGEYENGAEEGTYYHPICYKQATSESYHLG
jgi:AbrB family looped-hinge helix DNA binding protein